jgi:phospholipid-binding lipoprotein MlaA
MRFSILITAVMATSLVAEVNQSKEIKVQEYTKQEKQELVDAELKKFAKKKHGAVIEIKEDENDDYSAGVGGYDDPLEPLNRVVFNINGALDIMLFEPLAHIYRNITPRVARTGVDNFLNNLASPLYAVNHLLQGEMDAFFQTTCSFAINTLFGGLGMVDMAEGLGLENKQAWFGQTLASWGIESGPYLVLPLFGSSTFRGMFGIAGDFMINPVGMIVKNDHRHSNRHLQQRNLYMAMWGVQIISEREKVIEFLDDLQKNSLDIYVSMRNVMYQRDQKMEKEINARS